LILDYLLNVFENKINILEPEFWLGAWESSRMA